MFQIGVCYAEMGPDPAACRIFIPLRNGVTFRSGIEQVNRETQACVTITVFHAWNTLSAIMRISDEKGPAETEEKKHDFSLSTFTHTESKFCYLPCIYWKAQRTYFNQKKKVKFLRKGRFSERGGGSRYIPPGLLWQMLLKNRSWIQHMYVI